MHIEVRKYRRFPVRAITQALDIKKSNVSNNSTVINISMGGIAFKSSSEFAVGDEVYFRLSGKSMNITGIIKRSEKCDGYYLYGVEFQAIPFVAKLKLSEFISKLCDYLISPGSIYLNAFN